MSAMFKQHRMRSFMADFGPLLNSDFIIPSTDFIKRRIAQSLSEDNILKDLRDLGSNRPVRIGKVLPTIAALSQIRDTWAFTHKARSGGGPKVPLKYYTHGVHRKGSVETIDVEIHPGLDSWEFIFDDQV
jgi:hypothetical protein